VIKLLLKAKDPDNAARTVSDMLAEGKKVAGFGHRVYRTEDPRATHLRVLSEELGKRTGHIVLYQQSQRVEQTVKAEKKLNAKRGLLLGVHLLLARNSGRPVHAGVRRQPYVGMDGARARAVPQQPADSSASRV